MGNVRTFAHCPLSSDIVAVNYDIAAPQDVVKAAEALNCSKELHANLGIENLVPRAIERISCPMICESLRATQELRS